MKYLSFISNFFKQQSDVTCVILEPTAANMGDVPAETAFLKRLRQLATQSGSLLIFDEVITGYRLTYGGAQHLTGIEPDLTILGKIIGGGLPIGAFGGSSKIMARLSPTGDVYQAGTLSGNPLSMAAGLSVLSRLSKVFYERLNQKTACFVSEVKKILSQKQAPVSVSLAGSMFTIFFNPETPRNFAQVSQSNQKSYASFFRQLLKAGVYFPPSAFEACFISEAHSQKELDKTLNALYDIEL